MKQRRFKLTIALKIADREDENFTADNTANEEVDLTIADDKADEVANDETIADDEAVEEEEEREEVAKIS